ncbi:MAG: STT3 domain-containing protein [Candidatus Nanoarchaeia archaeon]
MSDEEIDFGEIGRKIKGWFSSDKKEKKPATTDEDELNFGEAVKFLKENKKIILYAALISIILVGAWVRMLSIPLYNGLLLGLDPYVFYRYTETLVEQGTLPEMDSFRYFPEGFSTFKEHQLVSYFVAGLYTIFHPLFGGELMSYSMIYPVVAFVISMIFFFLMTKEIFNKKTALIATAFLSLIPSYLFRTMAGFSDKEALATVFWFSMIYALVKSIRANKTKQALIYGLISGVLAGLSSLTWGGANFLFFSIGLAFLFLALMGKLSNKNVITYFAWFIPIILMNATMTLRYNGFGLIMIDMFLIPTITALVLGLKIVYDLFISNLIKNKKWPDNFYFVIMMAVLIMVGLPVMQLTGLFDVGAKLQGALDTILNPFGTCAFCVSVTENQAPWFYDPNGVDWWHRLQWFVPLFVIGGALLVQEVLGKFGKKATSVVIMFTVFILFFMFSKFVNLNGYEAINLFFENTYLLTLPLLALTVILFYIKFHKSSKWGELTPSKLIIILWFALSVIATRGAIRIVFASTPIFVLLAAYAIERINNLISKITSDKVYSTAIYAVAILLVIWSYYVIVEDASTMIPSFTNDWGESMSWVRNNTDTNAVFTHWWDYGYWVQTMGERATTVDGGNFQVVWDEVIGGQMFSGFNMTEVYDSLDYFKNNETGNRPNYLLVMDDDILKYVQMANIGGRPGYYAPYTYSQQVDNNLYNPEQFSTLLVFNYLASPGYVGADTIIDGVLFPKGESYIVNVLIPMAEDQSFGQPQAVVYNLATGSNTLHPYNCVCDYGNGCTYFNETNGIDSCIEFIEGGLIHIPSDLNDRFMTHLYLLNETIPGFELVYSSNSLNIRGLISQYDPTNINIYHINYTAMMPWVDNGSPAW